MTNLFKIALFTLVLSLTSLVHAATKCKDNDTSCQMDQVRQQLINQTSSLKVQNIKPKPKTETQQPFKIPAPSSTEINNQNTQTQQPQQQQPAVKRNPGLKLYFPSQQNTQAQDDNSAQTDQATTQTTGIQYR